MNSIARKAALKNTYKPVGYPSVAFAESGDDMADAVDSLLQANKLLEARLRLTITSGSVRGASPDTLPQSTLLITAAKMEPYPPELYRFGILERLIEPGYAS